MKNNFKLINQAFLILFVFCLFIPKLAIAGEKVKNLPQKMQLMDSREKFMTPYYKAKNGEKFRLSIGECMGGDPGFGSFANGDEFDLDLYIYHMEPKHPMGFESKRIVLAKGKYGKKITLLRNKPVKVKYKGLTFKINVKSLDANFGAGKSVVIVETVN